MSEPILRITDRKFRPDTEKVCVYRNWLRPSKFRNHIWNIEALEGRCAGHAVGMAVVVDMIGPIGFIHGVHPAVTGYLSTSPIALTNPIHHDLVDRWRGPAPAAGICTSDGEFWMVLGGQKPTTRVGGESTKRNNEKGRPTP